MFEIERFYVESAVKSAGILHPIANRYKVESIKLCTVDYIYNTIPHGGAVEMDHHPFGRIECDRVGELDAVEPVTEFRAQESRSSVSGINVQPNILGTT